MRTATLLLTALLAVVVAAAPVPKDKENEKPATDEQRQEVQDRLKQIVVALHAYADANNGWWPSDTKAGLSWRVQLLPDLDEEKLYKEFKLDEAWDSEANKKLIEKLPKVYAPTRVKAEKGETFYRGFGGNGNSCGAFITNGRVKMPASFADGTTNTIAVIDAGEPVIWTKPGNDLETDPKKPLPKLGRMIDGDFYCVMADGTLRKVKRKFHEASMRAAISIAGGDVVVEKSLFEK